MIKVFEEDSDFETLLDLNQDHSLFGDSFINIGFSEELTISNSGHFYIVLVPDAVTQKKYWAIYDEQESHFSYLAQYEHNNPGSAQLLYWIDRYRSAKLHKNQNWFDSLKQAQTKLPDYFPHIDPKTISQIVTIMLERKISADDLALHYFSESSPNYPLVLWNKISHDNQGSTHRPFSPEKEKLAQQTQEFLQRFPGYEEPYFFYWSWRKNCKTKPSWIDDEVDIRLAQKLFLSRLASSDSSRHREALHQAAKTLESSTAFPELDSLVEIYSQGKDPEPQVYFELGKNLEQNQNFEKASYAYLNAIYQADTNYDEWYQKAYENLNELISKAPQCSGLSEIHGMYDEEMEVYESHLT